MYKKAIMTLILIIQMLILIATLDMWYMDRKFYNTNMNEMGDSKTQGGDINA